MNVLSCKQLIKIQSSQECFFLWLFLKMSSMLTIWALSYLNDSFAFEFVFRSFVRIARQLCYVFTLKFIAIFPWDFQLYSFKSNRRTDEEYCWVGHSVESNNQKTKFKNLDNLCKASLKLNIPQKLDFFCLQCLPSSY